MRDRVIVTGGVLMFAAWLEALRKWLNPPLPPSDSRQIVFE